MTTSKRRWPGPETAPFQRGNLMEWVAPDVVRRQATSTERFYDTPDEWRPNVPFEAILTLTGIERGRSAARFMWYGTGNTYPMFMIDACALMLRGEALQVGARDGWWIVMKRGQNYGIAAIDPPDDHHVPTELVEASVKDLDAVVDRELVRAARERADADGTLILSAVCRMFNLRGMAWVSVRLREAYAGDRPLPGMTVDSYDVYTFRWKVSFTPEADGDPPQ